MSMSDSVISSRIRLARNISGVKFPNVCAREELLSVAKIVGRICSELFQNDFILMRELNDKKKYALVEQHLISLKLAKNEASGAVILDKQNQISIMLNEEDHIRAQCILPGFELDQSFEIINRIDNALLNSLKIAYDDELGFLTACPTNVGTAMRASVMLHLPALKMSGLIQGKVGEVVRRNGLTFRGVYGEGSDYNGGICQLSNSVSIGVTELEIVEAVKAAVKDICLIEDTERNRLLNSGAHFRDRIFRSYGILSNCVLLKEAEFLEFMSDVRLGIVLNILPKIRIDTFDKLITMTGTAVLSQLTKSNDEAEIDFLRAKIVREVFPKTN